MNVQREKITHAVVEYDQKELHRSIRNPRAYHNPNAIGMYLSAVGCACEKIQRGQDTRSALVDCFCGRLLDKVLKAVGEPKSTDAEQRIGGKLGF